MLVSRRNGRLLLVEQKEHGRIAGKICDRWGNDRFSRPRREASARIAAAMHDDGWREADAEPLFNAQEGRPLNFLEIEMTDHVPLYRRGVERVYQRDLYAGLLVSMHWTGLYRGRWGLQTGGVFRSRSTDEATRLQDEAIDEQEQRWVEVRRELMAAEPRTDFEIGLWHNYDLLQALDLISLYLCTANLAPSAGSEPQRLTDVLGSIDQEPGPRVIPSIPVRPGGNRVDLVLEPGSDGAVVVDPYPFDRDSVEVTIAARAIPDFRYESPEALRDALAGADDATLDRSLVRG